MTRETVATLTDRVQKLEAEQEQLSDHDNGLASRLDDLTDRLAALEKQPGDSAVVSTDDELRAALREVVGILIWFWRDNSGEFKQYNTNDLKSLYHRLAPSATETSDEVT